MIEKQRDIAAICLEPNLILQSVRSVGLQNSGPHLLWLLTSAVREDYEYISGFLNDFMPFTRFLLVKYLTSTVH